jgi:hypothetical protein
MVSISFPLQASMGRIEAHSHRQTIEYPTLLITKLFYSPDFFIHLTAATFTVVSVNRGTASHRCCIRDILRRNSVRFFTQGTSFLPVWFTCISYNISPTRPGSSALRAFAGEYPWQKAPCVARDTNRRTDQICRHL